MDVEFDVAKDASNIAKHRLSLADAARMDLLTAAVSLDDRGYNEPRFVPSSASTGLDIAWSSRFAAVVRPISFRRAHDKALRRHGR